MTETLGIVLPPKPPPATARATRATASEMTSVLYRHYVPDESRPAGVFLSEIQAPGPVGRRADVVWLGCTAATGDVLIGHEIKVTRQDLLTELADLSKSDPWQKYCDRWYLVVPDVSLIKGLDLPESWGVMLPPSGRRTRSMTIHRPAPVLQPREQAPALRTIAARQLWTIRDNQNLKDRQVSEIEDLRAANQKLRDQVPRGIPDKNRDIVTRIVRELGGTAGGEIGDWGGTVSVEDVVAVLKDLRAIHGRRADAVRALEYTRSNLATAQATIRRALSECAVPGVTNG